MKVSVCIDAVLRGKRPEDAIRALKNAGAQGFEFWGWWDKDMAMIKQAVNETGLVPVAMCTKFASLTDPACRELYIEGLAASIEVANSIGCKMLISQVGDDTGAPRPAQHQSIVEGLRACVPMLAAQDILLVLEPLNTVVDHKGYYLFSSAEGFEIVEEVASPYVKLLYDIYHQQIMEGNILHNMTGQLEKIGHIHAAGVPGRHELYLGELNYPMIFSELDRAGYIGYAGFEYFPAEEPLQGVMRFL